MDYSEALFYSVLAAGFVFFSVMLIGQFIEREQRCRKVCGWHTLGHRPTPDEHAAGCSYAAN